LARKGSAGDRSRKKRGRGDDAAEAAERAAADSEARAPLEERIEELEKELEAARAEAAEASDRALRTLAEFDNFRKRSRREQQDARQAGAAEVLGELLNLADDFDRALEHAGADVPDAFLEGLRLLAGALHGVLDRQGVERIESVGRAFDPRVHEALSAIADDGAEPNTVLQELQAGWRMGDRVLRPAKVVVCRAAQPVESASPADETAGNGGADEA
jgi:molecular chaperone GrpE